MSVERRERPAVARFARWALECAVRHWPKENRTWGLALGAEIDETASAFETVRWSLGGIMFFTRSVQSAAWRWMKLPAGTSPPGGTNGPEESSLVPKRSRALTAAILAVAALLLLLPEGREAIGTVRASWQGFLQTKPDERKLNDLATRARKDKDAGTLAFVGLSTDDSQSAWESMERAVSFDRSFVWVFGARADWPSSVTASQRWIEKMQAADPDNAFPYLLAADALVEPRLHEMALRGGTAPKEREALASDAEWIALMDRAFAEPRYDSYLQKHAQLSRIIWNHERNLTPAIVLIGLSRHRIPNLFIMKTFAEIKLDEAKQARAAGDVKRAARVLEGLARFAEQMANSSQTRIEKLIGLTIARSADGELLECYSNTDRSEDAKKIAQKREQIEAGLLGLEWGHDPEERLRMARFRRNAMMVQVSALVIFAVGFCALSGIFVLEVRRRSPRKTIGQTMLCFVADFSPIVLLVASVAFVLSYLPYRRALADYRSSNDLLADHERVTYALGSLMAFPQYVLGVDAAEAFWASVTVALSALLLVVLVRGFYRTRRAAANPA